MDLEEEVARAICDADPKAPASDSPVLSGMTTMRAWESRLPQAHAVIRVFNEYYDKVPDVDSADWLIEDGLD